MESLQEYRSGCYPAESPWAIQSEQTPDQRNRCCIAGSGCSMPLGMQSGVIIPYQLSASTSLHSVFSSWVPNLARLKQQGRINAWRPQDLGCHPWPDWETAGL